ncbi:molybdate ABC transporter substrate-binding protein [Microbacterium koreense]
MATRHLLIDLVAAVADGESPALEIESVGGVDAARRLRAGEPFDLVFLAAGALGSLADDGRVDGATLTPIVESEVAVAVPGGDVEAPARVVGVAFDDEAALRDAVVAAARIGISSGPSGIAVRQLFADWGVADRLVEARPGVAVAELVAARQVDLGFQQASELIGHPGVRVLGTLPHDCAIRTVFAGAVAETATDPLRARRYLVALAGACSADLRALHGFEMPVSLRGD